MIWFTYIASTIFFFIWNHGEYKLKEFMAAFNAFNPNIQFTLESSKKDIAFLDFDVALCNGRLESTVHVKPTDSYQYLHYSFSHPEHTKRPNVFSQTLPVIRTSCGDNDFRDHCFLLKSWFLKKNYPEKLIDNKMKRVNFFPANLQT